ncbi:SsgA family sporulation/cell division regulator [Nonomuraea sp. SYSU D8015]|uniref:SsgA family sporulation/cell division regulator n=1 Tax=Nonomuraea sp. SYSU D8015 TaxID=2593644 RepID=UPI00166111F9|nr:SsgA family sporulation/cell division regulator [Nonomuraea sp. SYSU D8015]
MRKILNVPILLWNAARHSDEPYTATIVYRSDDPFAVEIVIPDHDGVHEVVLYRDLLIDGLEKPTGESGFPLVKPHAVRDYITLTVPCRGGLRELYAERDAVEAFLEKTCRMVPLNRQRPIARAELDRWLAEVTA